MPLVPNYISRLRTHSQSTDTSANTATDSRFTDLITDTSLTTNTSLHPIAELDQKVLSNSDTSLEGTTLELNTEEHTGPTLPRHKARLPKHLAVTSGTDMPIEQVGPSVNADAASPPSSPRSPLLSRILSAPLRGGARAQSNSPSDFEKESIPEGGQTSWATFGRRLPGMPRLGEFGSFHGRESNAKSSSRRSKQTSTSNGHSRAQTLESQSASPAGTVSSSSISQSHSRRHALPDQIPDIEPEASHDHSLSYHTSQSHVDPLTPKHSMPFPDGVPNTFGRGTSRAPLSGQGDASNNAFSPTRTSTPPPPERLARRSPPGTYPQRSRKRSSPTVGSVSFPILPRRSSKPSFSRTRADDIFRVRHSPAPKRKGRESDPIQKDERNAPRQPDADLFARQVISDLGPDDSLDSSWAAGVSREIVRLSLALSGTGGSQVQLPVEIEEARKERERAEIGIVSQDEDGGKNPTLFGSVGEDRRVFLRAAQKRTGSGVLQATSAEESSQASGSSSTPGARRGVPRVSAVTTRPLSSFNTRLQTFSDPGPSPSSSSAGILSMFEPPTSSGKRKMAVESQEDVTLKEPKGILVHRRDSKLPSDASHAPSSFRQPKRIRLSTPTHNPASLSRPSSPPSRPSSSLRSHTGSPPLNSRRLSQTSLASSLPVRAIVSPKPPSIDRSSAGTAYHMRDPNLPPSRRHSTQWTGAARRRWGDEEWGGFGGIGGKRGTYFPFQGWAFVLGFILFPLWWIAALVPVRWERVREREQPEDGRGLPLWETEEEKVARETVRYDVAYTWRKRCRIMSVVGLFIYVPLIVLLGVLIPRTS